MENSATKRKLSSITYEPGNTVPGRVNPADTKLELLHMWNLSLNHANTRTIKSSLKNITRKTPNNRQYPNILQRLQLE